MFSILIISAAVIGGSFGQHKAAIQSDLKALAYLEVKGEQSAQCLGILISDDLVLTPAYCLPDLPAEDLQVALGSVYMPGSNSTGRVVQVKKVIPHPKYQPDLEYPEYDIALVILKSHVPPSDDVKPACLPDSRLNMDNKPVSVIGSYYDEDKRAHVPRRMSQTILPVSKCASYYKLNTRNPTQLCTNIFTKDSPDCKGQEEAIFWPVGLFSRESDTVPTSLVGIVSYGLDCSLDKPGVSTDVTAFTAWIQSSALNSGVEPRICFNKIPTHKGFVDKVKGSLGILKDIVKDIIL